MALTAKKVYAILKHQISDMEAKLNSPVRYRGTVATVDLLPLNPDIGDMYNIESKSVYGEAGMNVAWNGVAWDTMGAPIDMSLYLTKEGADTTIQNMVNEYLEKNPVKPGATTEQARQIEQNKTNIASLKVETSSLKEEKIDATELISDNIEDGFFNTNGENTSATGCKRTVGYVDISKYSKIIIKTDSEYENSSYYPILFTNKDASGNVINGSHKIEKINEYTVPSGAKYVRAFSFGASYINVYGYTIEGIKTDLEDIKTDVLYSGAESGGYDNSGKDDENASYIRTPFIDVENSDTITVYTDTDYEANERYPILFFSKDIVGTEILDGSSHSIVDGEKYTVPSGAKYVRAFTGSSGTFIKIERSKIGTIENKVDALSGELDALPNVKEYIHQTEVYDIFADKTTHAGCYINQSASPLASNYYYKNPNFNASNLNEVKPNTIYTVICMRYNNGELFNFCDAIFYDENYNFISKVQNTNKFTTPSNAKYLIITVYSTSYSQGSTDDLEQLIIENSDGITYPLTKNRLKSIRGCVGCEGKKWMVIGDSITEKNFRTLANYHDFVAEDLGLTVINCGVSGSGYKVHDTDDDYIETIPPFYKRISSYSQYSPDLITIMGGINDLMFSSKQMGEITDTTADTWLGAAYLLIQNIKATFPDIPYAIISPLPQMNYNTADTSNKEYVFVKKLEQFCDYHNIPFLNLYNKSGFRPWDDDFRKTFTSCKQEQSGDGLHPNVKGHELIYPRIREFVKTLI